MSQVIEVTAGAVEYTWPLTATETTGKDISGDAVFVSLGAYDEPADWVAPDVLTRPSVSSVTVQILVSSSVPVGEYWVWVRVTDSPETVPRRGERVTVS